jgi:hypothetical protein
MTRRQVLLLVFHGVLLVVLGMLVGIPFREAILSGWGEDAQRAWRVAHTSLVGGGALYLALAAVAQHLVLGPRAAAFVAGSLVFAAWTFVIGFVVGPAVGARGLEPVGPALHLVVFAAFAAGLLLAFLALGTVLWGSFVALRRAGSE